jgi:GNAT superfamily N-acetyltransferase
MLAHNEARIRQLAAEHPAEMKKVFVAGMGDQQHGSIALMEKTGYARQRFFYFMLRPLDKPIPDYELPDGLETRPVDESQLRQIWDAQNEAFRDHWGHIEGDEDDYKRWSTDPVWDLSMWQVAWEGDEIAGIILNHEEKEDNAKLGVKWAFTDPISVRRPWRRRGLARNLILKSLKMLKELGYEHAALGVDTQNPSGALGLYESCGYEVDERWIVYEKPME